MNCRDFERAWNERIDARGAAPADLDQAIDGHAAACLDCRKLDARYRTLRRAISMAVALPRPSPGFTDRVLAAAARDGRPVIWRLVPRLAAAVAVGWGLTSRGPRREAEPTVALVRAIDPNDLTDALGDASTATWDLAREASAPAARVGRQVFDSSEMAATAPVLSLPEGVGQAVGVWREVGDRVNAGVRPLEGSARHAFGFLLDAPPEEDLPAPARPASGA
jgi:hypothetical protein